MPRYTPDEIRTKFANSTDFNDLFDAFEDAISQRIQDVELYRLLFWNHSLGPDELCLFGEKLAKEFTGISYDIYMWLASVFEVTIPRTTILSSPSNITARPRKHVRAFPIHTSMPAIATTLISTYLQ